jgi:hypothetical protein
MSRGTSHRSKHWWLWPDFYDEKDARDAAKMGIIACAIIAVTTGAVFTYRYSITGDIEQLFGGLFMFIIYCALGYGIFKMSRAASSIALILFLFEKVYSFLFQGTNLGLAILLLWFLFQANRATYWFRRWQKMAKDAQITT